MLWDTSSIHLICSWCPIRTYAHRVRSAPWSRLEPQHGVLGTVKSNVQLVVFRHAMVAFVFIICTNTFEKTDMVASRYQVYGHHLAGCKIAAEMQPNHHALRAVSCVQHIPYTLPLFDAYQNLLHSFSQPRKYGLPFNAGGCEVHASSEHGYRCGHRSHKAHPRCDNIHRGYHHSQVPRHGEKGKLFWIFKTSSVDCKFRRLSPSRWISEKVLVSYRQYCLFLDQHKLGCLSYMYYHT